jgi:hypothetical protein
MTPTRAERRFGICGVHNDAAGGEVLQQDGLGGFYVVVAKKTCDGIGKYRKLELQHLLRQGSTSNSLHKTRCARSHDANS